MRLTIDLVRRAPQFTNTLQQREIDLRGLSLSMLDEGTLVLLENKFDVINLTSNALTTLEYFPVPRTGSASASSSSSNNTSSVVMDRVVTLVAHRNQLHKVSIASCALALPNVRHFLADRNAFATVKSLFFVSYWKALEVVALEGCPVWDNNPECYDAAMLRAFLVHMCPTLLLINYERVTQRDRDAARAHRETFTSLVRSWQAPLPTAATTTTTTTLASALRSADGHDKRTRVRARSSRAQTVTTAAGSAANDNTAINKDGNKTRDDDDNSSHSDMGYDGSTTTTSMQRAASSAAQAKDTAAAAGNDADDEADVQAQLNAIEERIMAEDLTADEMVALEQQMNELTAELERRKRRKLS